MKCILLRDSNKVLQNTTPERKSFVMMGNAKQKMMGNAGHSIQREEWVAE